MASEEHIKPPKLLMSAPDVAATLGAHSFPKWASLLLGSEGILPRSPTLSNMPTDNRRQLPVAGPPDTEEGIAADGVWGVRCAAKVAVPSQTSCSQSC